MNVEARRKDGRCKGGGRKDEIVGAKRHAEGCGEWFPFCILNICILQFHRQKMFMQHHVSKNPPPAG